MTGVVQEGGSWVGNRKWSNEGTTGYKSFLLFVVSSGNGGDDVDVDIDVGCDEEHCEDRWLSRRKKYSDPVRMSSGPLSTARPSLVVDKYPYHSQLAIMQQATRAVSW